MSKIIKLKQSDIKNIVKNVLNEQIDNAAEDTKIIPQDSDITIAKDQQGRIVVINTKSGEILGTK